MFCVFIKQSLLFFLFFLSKLLIGFPLPSSFTIILSFFFIDPCVGLRTVFTFPVLSYSSVSYIRYRYSSLDPSKSPSQFLILYISLLMSASYSHLWFICYPLGASVLFVFIFYMFYLPFAFTHHYLLLLLSQPLVIILLKC